MAPSRSDCGGVLFSLVGGSWLGVEGSAKLWEGGEVLRTTGGGLTADDVL